MSSASSIRRSEPGAPGAGSLPPTRSRAFFTWLLAGLWLFLMLFAVVSLMDPPWLQALTRGGVESEYKDYKHYGDDALRQGDVPLAIAQYEHALAIHPEGVEVMINLGTAWAKAGFAAKGEPYLRQALDKSRSAVSRGIILANLAELAETAGRRQEAIALIRESIASGDELEKRYLKLGTLLLADGKHEEGLAALEQSVAAQTDPALGYRSMLMDCLDTYADSPELLAVVQAQLSAPLDEGFLAPYDLESIRAVQRTDRRLAVTHNYAGWALINLNRFAEAVPHFEASLRIWPNNPNAEQNLATIRRMEQDQRR